MLILVAVTVNVAMDGGLFEKSQDAKAKTDKNSEKEQLISAAVGALDNNTGTYVASKMVLPEGMSWVDEETKVAVQTPKGNIFYIDSKGNILEEPEKDVTQNEFLTSIQQEDVWENIGFSNTLTQPDESAELWYFEIRNGNNIISIEFDPDEMIIAMYSDNFKYFYSWTNQSYEYGDDGQFFSLIANEWTVIEGEENSWNFETDRFNGTVYTTDGDKEWTVPNEFAEWFIKY